MRASLLLLALVFCSSPAIAGVPDPGHSALDPCLVVCPAGDSFFHVIVRDIVGNPIAGSTVIVDLCSCPSVVPCPGGGCAQIGHTDASGSVTFAIKAGGVCAAGALITADGVVLGVRAVASPDQNGDLFVDAADVAVAVGKIGSADPTADLDCDHFVTPSDVTIIGAHQGHACDTVPTHAQSWGHVKAIYR